MNIWNEYEIEHSLTNYIQYCLQLLGNKISIIIFLYYKSKWMLNWLIKFVQYYKSVIWIFKWINIKFSTNSKLEWFEQKQSKPQKAYF